MTERRPHSRTSLLAIAIAATTAFFAGVFGPSTLLATSIILLLGLARERGFGFVRVFDRPKLFAILGIGYLLFFFADILLLGRINPVPALGRLVVFLVAAEILSGDASRAHRPVLFGFLLLVASAAQTTDFWFALPLAAFTWAAACSQMGHNLLGVAAGEAAAVGPVPLGASLKLAVASLATGALFFLLIPRVGAGWGGMTGAAPEDGGFETGLASSVRLGAVGRIKVRRSVAFHVKLDREDVDPETLYWRARSYDLFTGDGWSRSSRAEDILSVPPNETVPIPPEYALEGADVVAEVTSGRASQTTLVVPGRGVWLRSPRAAMVHASADGALWTAPGRALRNYTIGVKLLPPRPSDARRDPRARAEQVSPFDLDAGAVDAEVVPWAEGIAPAGAPPGYVVQAFLQDLSKRSYSLDTRSIDPLHPLASFLSGAPAHCEYFATAMALGLRVRKIPARVAAGYLGAERLPFGPGLVVRDSRAHLWTEVYLPAQGWVAFDPTPAAGRVVPSESFSWITAAWDRVVVGWDSWVIGLDLVDQVDLFLNVREIFSGAGRRLLRSPLLWPLFGAPLLLGVALWLRRRRGRGASRGFFRLPRPYRALLAIAARRGLKPRATETAGEFARRAGLALGDEATVEAVSRLYERERFGGRAPSPGEVGAAMAALARLRRGAAGAIGTLS